MRDLGRCDLEICVIWTCGAWVSRDAYILFSCHLWCECHLVIVKPSTLLASIPYSLAYHLNLLSLNTHQLKPRFDPQFLGGLIPNLNPETYPLL